MGVPRIDHEGHEKATSFPGPDLNTLRAPLGGGQGGPGMKNKNPRQNYSNGLLNLRTGW